MKTNSLKYTLAILAGGLIGAGSVYGAYHSKNKTLSQKSDIGSQNLEGVTPDNSSNTFGQNIESDFDQFTSLMNKQMQNFRSQVEAPLKNFDQLQKTTVNMDNQKDGVLYKISLNNPKDDISVKVANGMLKFEEKMSKKDQSQKGNLNQESDVNYISTQVFSLPDGVDENNFSQKVVGSELQVFFPKIHT